MLEFFHRIPTLIKYAIVAGLSVLLITFGTKGLTNIAVTGGSIISRDYATSMTYDVESNKTTFVIEAKVFNGDHFTMETIQLNLEALDTLGEKNQVVSNDVPCSIAPGTTELTTTSLTLTGEYLNIKLVSWKPVSWKTAINENWIGYVVAAVYYVGIAIVAFVAYLKRMGYRKYYVLMTCLFIACLLPAVLIPINWYRFEWVGNAVMDGVSLLLLAWALASFILIVKDVGFELTGVGSGKKLIKALVKEIWKTGNNRAVIGGMRLGTSGGDILVISRSSYKVFLSPDGAGVFGGGDSEQDYISLPVTDKTQAHTPHGKAFLRDFPRLLEDLKVAAEKATGKTYSVKGFIKIKGGEKHENEA